MRARIGEAEDALRGRGRAAAPPDVVSSSGSGPTWKGGGSSRTAPLALVACLLAGARARSQEREAREAGHQEKHRGWFRDARITPHAGAREGRLCQRRPVLEHDGGSQLIEHEGGTCSEGESCSSLRIPVLASCGMLSRGDGGVEFSELLGASQRMTDEREASDLATVENEMRIRPGLLIVR